ncbi:Vng6120h (plasmid) [Halobacterium salinarum NRC-1]|uniref:Vng6120h n=3 Tax=Halobacterium salinarum TaxID=2242 RepID=Q9HI10_HALSA|nr:hypothetical protein [Halobacterium salinarum]AAG20797.1 Vng6120h [Halobacterium salinarum NRC-1]MBB6091072.1 hypothetical protein [Halobacterium salinarum]CAP15138.2 uncharacterized protein OE_7160R [Halobacterium salinarum R1]DAC79570.1 TPA_inf: uncharacterized protein VNG_7085a [Halobacterium salinarum NRC-1]DAC79768.1 TPA_inf: uncharacterized protein VNG_6120H [Halobacterium salinarum NRC-1]
MPLHDNFDYWSPIAAFVALSLFVILALARPALPVALALALGVTVFVAGISPAVRERLPSYNRLIGAYCGVFGLARFASEGWTSVSAALVLVGVVSVLELAYERMTGRSADIV